MWDYLLIVLLQQLMFEPHPAVLHASDEVFIMAALTAPNTLALCLKRRDIHDQ